MSEHLLKIKNVCTNNVPHVIIIYIFFIAYAMNMAMSSSTVPTPQFRTFQPALSPHWVRGSRGESDQGEILDTEIEKNQ